MFDGKAFGIEIVSVVKDYVGRALDPLLARIEAIESRSPIDGKDGRDGKDAAPVTRDMILDAVASSPDLIAEAVSRHLADNPPAPGKDGRDGEPGKAGDPGHDGKDAEPVTRDMILEAIIASPDVIDEAVLRHLEANPPPAGKNGQDGKDGAPGEPGRGGVGLAGMLIDRSGALVATMTDGSVCPLGPVVGRDGLDGQPGAPGRDGADGLGFDDMTAEYDGERVITLRFARGDLTKDFPLTMPVVLDRGVFKDGTAYEAGDAVTWGGSLWIAQKATTDKPEAGDGWRLAVKRGRDGKQGEPGKSGATGSPGRPGKDLTQLGPDGSKW